MGLAAELIESKVYVRIHDFDCDWNVLSDILKINPTKAWNKGDLIPDRNIPIYRKQSTWEIKSPTNSSESITEHIINLLKIIEPSKKEFCDLISKYGGELAIVMHVKGSTNPGFSLDKDILAKINTLNLEIDFDIYFFPS